jgi:hypothetical protein
LLLKSVILLLDACTFILDLTTVTSKCVRIKNESACHLTINSKCVLLHCEVVRDLWALTFSSFRDRVGNALTGGGVIGELERPIWKSLQFRKDGYVVHLERTQLPKL